MAPVRFLNLFLFYGVTVISAGFLNHQHLWNPKGPGMDDNTCIFSKGQNGTCVNIRNCSYALGLIRSRERPVLCEFIGKEPIVCCPKENGYKPDKLMQGSKLFKPECSIVKAVGPTLGPIYATVKPPGQTLGPIYMKLDGSNQTFTSLDDLSPQGRRGKRQATIATVDEPDDFHIAVSGGSSVAENEYPHMVRLGIGQNPSSIEWFCGGTLISDKFILTAAHCIHSRFGSINWARLGAASTPSLQETTAIVTNHVHPNFIGKEHYHDIALSELRESVGFNDYIKPACVHVEREIPPDFPIVVTGWGATEYGGEQSDNLLKATVDLYSFEECTRTYPKTIRKIPNGLDNDTQVCAGSRSGIQDTCQGDSGGPIHVEATNKDSSRINVVFGVTSFGKVCGVSQPGVYVRVFPYLPWIDSLLFSLNK